MDSPERVGTLFGSYRVEALIGAGGMGRVYRATDTRLQRAVALKVLAPKLAGDPEFVARLEREARLLASLNHPNIAAIYGLEHADDAQGLVLEFVDGPTLADRLRSGPVPVNDALTIARQIAAALDAAHERGIVHRDLKPANIKLQGAWGPGLRQGFGQARRSAEGAEAATPTRLSGGRLEARLSATDVAGCTVKVLDFGIAKLAPDVTSSQATTLAHTAVGVVLGTPAYMSPEQARGKPTDRRTDIWAFGCVLFEMLTGRLAFPGDTASDAIAATLEREPDWSALPSATPPSARRLVRRCLAKDPEERLRDIGDARLELDEKLDGAASGASVPAPSRRLWPRIAAAATVAVLVVAAGFLGRLTAPQSSSLAGAPVQFWISPPRGTEFLRGPNVTFLALSPDGSQLAFVVQEPSGISRLWLQPLSALVPQPLAGTDGAEAAFWAPNGRSLGFFAGGKLKRVDLDRNAVVTLCDTPKRSGFSGTWGADDRILFAPVSSEGIYSVSAGGGTSAIEIAQAGELGVKYPWFLPDGRRFLYLAVKPGGDRRVMLAEPGRTPRALITSPSNAQWIDPDAIVFARADGTLVAQRVDLTRGEAVGPPAVIAASVDYALGPARAMFAAASNGTVVYQPQQASRLILVDRTGQEVGQAGLPGDYLNVRISRDGRRVLFDRMQMGMGTYDIWIGDLTKPGVEDKVTDDPGNELGAVWLPDGAVAYASGPGVSTLFSTNLNTRAVQTLIDGGDMKVPMDVSPDGKTLTFTERSTAGSGMWTLGLSGGAKPVPLHESRAGQGEQRFSPNGQFVAYISNETGRNEIHVAPFPNGAGRRISPEGGTVPRWSRDGRQELFYLAMDGRLVAVALAANGAPMVEAQTTLFRTGAVAKWRTFDVFPDGKRFIAVAPPVNAPIAVVHQFRGDSGR